MKKMFFPAFYVVFCLFLSDAYAYEVKGLSPIAPYGIFSTFTADGLEKGKSAAGLGFERAKEPSVYKYIMQYSYGITDKVELITTLPYASRWESSKSGFEDFALGVKHNFHEESKSWPSFAYLLGVSAGNGEKQFTTDGRITGGLIISKRIGPVSGHGNFIFHKAGSGTKQDEINYSAGFDFSAAHNFKVIGELFGRKTIHSDEFRQLEGRLGYRFIAEDNIFTTIGAGYGLTSKNPEYRFFLSISVILPFEKKQIKTIYEEDK